VNNLLGEVFAFELLPLIIIGFDLMNYFFNKEGMCLQDTSLSSTKKPTSWLAYKSKATLRTIEL